MAILNIKHLPDGLYARLKAHVDAARRAWD
jgi:plasmid stability protein